MFHANVNQKRAGMAILISNKINIQSKLVMTDKEGHYIMINESINQEDITIVNIYVPNIGAPKYLKEILTELKGEIDSNIIIVGDFNTPLLALDRSFR